MKRDVIAFVADDSNGQLRAAKRGAEGRGLPRCMTSEQKREREGQK